MPLKQQVRLLSTVDILEPLSSEELEELGQRAPDTHLIGAHNDRTTYHSSVIS
jgi:hypothetical protein